MSLDFLPLKSYANIIEGNALRLDWESVVPKHKLNPQTIICFGEPLPEMHGNIVFVDYRASRKVVR